MQTLLYLWLWQHDSLNNSQFSFWREETSCCVLCFFCFCLCFSFSFWLWIKVFIAQFYQSVFQYFSIFPLTTQRIWSTFFLRIFTFRFSKDSSFSYLPSVCRQKYLFILTFKSNANITLLMFMSRVSWQHVNYSQFLFWHEETSCCVLCFLFNWWVVPSVTHCVCLLE